MNPNRRRKKRPSYGVRTVEIVRGRHGFGFTISGQGPCILSSIVSGSPADRAGLRTGDYLIAVDGRNVVKALHDDVVRTIGSCQGLLKIQIAENYYSNSSDEDDDADDNAMANMARPRPKYPHRFRHKHNQMQMNRMPISSITEVRELCPTPTCRRQRSTIEATVRQLGIDDYKNISDVSIRAYMANDQGPLKNDNRRYLTSKYSAGPSSTPLSSRVLPVVAKSTDRRQKSTRKEPTEAASWGCEVLEKENQRPLYGTKGLVQSRRRARSNSPVQNNPPVNPFGDTNSGEFVVGQLEEPIFKAVVGYLGTIEMPKEPQVSGRLLSAIHSCIRRLRVEKKVHTLVLLKVFCNCVTLTDSNGAQLAEYPTASIAFCGAYADDKRFFGLVTARSELSTVEQVADGGSLYSSSCHVFMTDVKLVLHADHERRALSFKLQCTAVENIPNDGFAECVEFPATVDTILVAIVGLYRGRNGIPMDLDANVSPQPSHTSSNSDSGIGFRDEGQNSDRVSVVDVIDRDYGICLDSQPQGTSSYSQKGTKTQASSCCETITLTRKDQSSAGLKLIVRAMPDPVGFSNSDKDVSFNTECLDAQQEPSNVRLSVQKYFQKRFTEQGKVGCSRFYDKLPCEPQPPRFMAPVLVSNSMIMQTSSNTFGDEEVDSVPLFPDDITDNICEQEGSQDVHPPTQEEDSDSSAQDNEGDMSPDDDDGGQRWSRQGSFRKRFRIPFGQSAKHREDTTLSAENRKTSDGGSLVGLNDDGGLMDVGRVGSWAVSFEKLLLDPAGLHTFSEFLKKEFSYENIVFWVACERFRKSAEKSRLKEFAKEIFERHLGVGALEPVNVDSRARRLTEDGLNRPDRNVFSQAQKQIYNLMKFDCYTRFLKSSLYRECMLKDVAGEPLPYTGAEELDTEVTIQEKTDGKDKKDKGEDRRRKSLLPWHRTKSGKLKTEKSKNALKKDKNPSMGSSWSDLTGSRSSLASSEALSSLKPFSTTESVVSMVSSNDEQSLCKIHLPDRSTTIVPVKSGECVENWIRNIVERRGLDLPNVGLRFLDDNRTVDPNSDSGSLSGCEVRVEERFGDVCARRSKPQTTLNELTIKVFDDLLRGRRSSVESNQLMRKINDNNCCHLKPPIAVRPSNLQPQPLNKNNEMYDLWKKAQCSRLDDQRGTEINFELPDFLKTRPEDDGRCHLDGRASEPIPSSRSNNQHDSAKILASYKSCDINVDGILLDGIIPTHKQAEDYFTGKSGSQFGRNFRNLIQPSINNIQQARCNMTARPCSHPPPKGTAPWLRSASVPVCDFVNRENSMAALSPVKEAPAATSFLLDASLTPSSIPLPIVDTSISGEIADFLPPTPINKDVTCIRSQNTRVEMTPPPPPLPPKPRFAPLKDNSVLSIIADKVNSNDGEKCSNDPSSNSRLRVHFFNI